MARTRLPRGAHSLELPKGCTSITYTRRSKGGSKLAKPIEIVRCRSRKLKGHNKKQCRVGGKGPKAHLFAKCRGR